MKLLQLPYIPSAILCSGSLYSFYSARISPFVNTRLFNSNTHIIAMWKRENVENAWFGRLFSHHQFIVRLLLVRAMTHATSSFQQHGKYQLSSRALREMVTVFNTHDSSR